MQRGDLGRLSRHYTVPVVIWSDLGNRFTKFEKKSGIVFRKNQIIGIFDLGEVCIVLDIQSDDQDNFAQILAPCGIGWIRAVYIESIS